MDINKIEEAWKKILIELGEDVMRNGLKDTPKRISKMYKELFRGYDNKQIPKITVFDNGKDGIVYDEMITDEGDFYSFCEHHVVPFFGSYHFAYIPSPNGKILGLSKVARIVDYFSAKLQIQERLVHDIVECIWNKLSKEGHPPLGMALYMEAEHLCKTMRGAKKKGKMTTKILKGCFKEDNKCREEFLSSIK